MAGGLILGAENHGPWLYEPADDWICCPSIAPAWGFSMSQVETLHDALEMVRHLLVAKSFATKQNAAQLCIAIQYWVADKSRRTRTDWHPDYAPAEVSSDD